MWYNTTFSMRSCNVNMNVAQNWVLDYSQIHVFIRSLLGCTNSLAPCKYPYTYYLTPNLMRVKPHLNALYHL